jgi:hypothetical protein
MPLLMSGSVTPVDSRRSRIRPDWSSHAPTTRNCSRGLPSSARPGELHLRCRERVPGLVLLLARLDDEPVGSPYRRLGFIELGQPLHWTRR